MAEQKYPLLLSPAAKDYLWGGENLKYNYNKNIDITPLAETWECSCHPDGESVVSNGALTGKTLSEVILSNPGWIGTSPDTSYGFPILFKLIDAKKELSVQVHPDDEYALANENQLGKTEMWYVLDAEDDAELVYGFKNEIDRDTLISSAKDGSIMEHLRTLKAERGDVFFITPGTVHAIGKGLTIAEIQESSNVTYRLYDYGRRDKDGNLRPLHLDKAAEVTVLKASSDPKQAKRESFVIGTAKCETLAKCKYFTTDKISVSCDYEAKVDDTSFAVLFMADNHAVLTYADGKLDLQKGDTVFLPAGIGSIKIDGKCEFLKITC